MNNEKLSSLQFSCLTCFPMLALFNGIGTHNTIKIAQIDSYISVFMAFSIGFIPLLLFLFIFNFRKELDMKEKINYLFGNFFGTIINYLINILILVIGIVLIYNISNFAISQFLAETPLLVFMLLIGVLLIYNVSLGIENISRVAVVFLGIIIFLTIISTSGAITDFELSNIKPTLENGIFPPFKGSIILTVTNVIPIFLLLVVPKNKISDNSKTNKHIILFYILAFLFMFMAMLLTLGSLGIYLSNMYQYPEYTVLKKISLFNFLDRIENFIYIKWILSSVICLSLVIYYIQRSVKKNSTKSVPTLISLLIIFLSLYIFKNNTIFYMVILNIFPYICLLLFLIFVIVGINILIRKVLNV